MIVELNLGKLLIKGPKNDYNRFLNLFGTAYISSLKQRVREGIDIYDKPFVPFSPGYQKWRIDHGRNPTEDFLQITGKMLQSMAITGTDHNQITIGFSGARPSGGPGKKKSETQVFNASIAYAHNEGIGRYGPITQRRFFGVVKKLVANAIAQTLKQIVNWSKSVK